MPQSVGVKRLGVSALEEWAYVESIATDGPGVGLGVCLKCGLKNEEFGFMWSTCQTTLLHVPECNQWLAGSPGDPARACPEDKVVGIESVLKFEDSKKQAGLGIEGPC